MHFVIHIYGTYTFSWKKDVQEDEEEQLPLELAKQVISLVHDSRSTQSTEFGTLKGICSKKWDQAAKTAMNNNEQ